MKIEREINKNSPEAETCYKKEYNNFFDGLNFQIKDSYFFSYVSQFMLVGLMFCYVGKGKYWKVLFYSSISGLIGAILEHLSIAYICQNSKRDEHFIVVPFLIEEILWIICEYSIPIINLFKMESLSTGKNFKIIKLIIYFLSIPFLLARLFIGYDRMMKGYLNTRFSKYFQSLAYGTISIADLICSISIILLAKSKNKKGRLDTTFTSIIKNSSYTVLITVDIASLLLSILYIISIYFPESYLMHNLTTLFYCFKSIFILILSTDALIFKYEFTYYNSGSFIQSDDNFSFNIEKPPINQCSIEIIASSNLTSNKYPNKKCYSLSRMPSNHEGSTSIKPNKRENSFFSNNLNSMNTAIATPNYTNTTSNRHCKSANEINTIYNSNTFDEDA
ncbi:hypothetical protein PIROE2DRAFT_11012 [Piromyces sp. E2]|nr:hypothetical protein PIROE2DRAFT_11012 [Piromyces sp. E2]|eukprot:OUM62637.1 hypothetical protein PIROE2DRAFT_11012 [Piromyces sp. E2]